MTHVALGIDAGGSSTRWCVLSENGELGSGTTLPITGHIFSERDLEQNTSRLRGLLKDALAVAQPDAVVAGVTGLHKDTPAQQFLLDFIASVLQIDASRITLDNDLHVAYASVFAPGEGLLLYAGTGAVAYHETVDGGEVRAGGYGYLIDDAGAGFWIGQQGLRSVLRHVDRHGQEGDSPLAVGIYEVLECHAWPDIMAKVYSAGRAQVAALTPAVIAAADAGDAVAIDILQRAGDELARLAADVQQRLPEGLPVAFSGGIAKHAPLVAARIKEKLAVPVQVVTARADLAAARLALSHVT